MLLLKIIETIAVYQFMRIYTQMGNILDNLNTLFDYLDWSIQKYSQDVPKNGLSPAIEYIK